MNAVTAVRVWSPYQEAIYDFGINGIGNAIIEAVAGSGKSTTLVELIRRILGVRPGASVLFLAFNKAIADELKKRGVNARTFHSLCFRAVLDHKRARDVTGDKLRRIVDEKLDEQNARIYGAFMTKLVGLARGVGIGCLIDDDLDTWRALVDRHDLDLDSDRGDIDTAIEYSRNLLDWSNASSMVDFDDLLYIAVKDHLSLHKSDFVLVDETQDLNSIQRAILRKVLKGTSRLFAVGDSGQSIYGFRGADSDSMSITAAEFNCTRLPLTVSYRCPTSVVEHARRWVAHIEAAPGAPEGAVTPMGTKWDTKTFQPLDLVVCRTTKPIIALAFKLIKARVPAKILGREIGQGLKTLINRMKTQDLETFLLRLETYTKREVDKATAKNDPEKAARIQDKTDSILCLVESLSEDERTVQHLLDAIDGMFTDVRNAVTLSTIHKAKGLEAERVLWLNSSTCPSKWARQEWQVQQEYNLCYVATTRAIKELILIEDAPK